MFFSIIPCYVALLGIKGTWKKTWMFLIHFKTSLSMGKGGFSSNVTHYLFAKQLLRNVLYSIGF